MIKGSRLTLHPSWSLSLGGFMKGNRTIDLPTSYGLVQCLPEKLIHPDISLHTHCTLRSHQG